MSKFDQFYRSLLITKIFTKGWGKPDELKRIISFRKLIADREVCQQFVENDYPVYIDKERTKDDYRILEGHFLSPLVRSVPGIMPKASEIARFQMILPHKWKTQLKPICVHLGGTGDHYYTRRQKLMAVPLLQEHGIGSIILENPYYGSRKPKHQLRSSLHYVSDLFVMGGALILECLALFHWCERMGYGPLGVTGISMGGFMASLAATNWPKPLSLIPCLSWSTASAVFTRGTLSRAIPWKILQHQYYTDMTYDREIRQLIHSPEPYWKPEQTWAEKFFGKKEENTNVNCSILESDRCRVSSAVINTSLGATSHNTGLILDTEPVSFNSLEDNLGFSQERGSLGNTESFAETNMPKETLDNTAHDPKHIEDVSSSHSNQSVSFSSTNHNQVNDASIIDQGSQKRYYATTSATGSKHGSAVHLSGNMSSKHKPPKEVLSTLHEASLDFMRGVMDECTHLGNFSVPLDPELAVIVAASHDSYVPRNNIMSLQNMWPGSEVRYIDAGHIMAFLARRDVFRQAIADSFQKQIKKYY